jgi:glucose-1-phosphate cytidylyltransferase
MKVVILAGGLGTRMTEETITKPKPMVEIGGKPILWHIMKHYSYYGLNDFIVCCGYKGYVIKEYFANYFTHQSDITFDLKENKMTVHKKHVEPWRVTLVNTGNNTMTGGRLRRVKSYLKDDKIFCLTYGDGVGDVNIKELVDFHKKSRRLATLTGAFAPGRFGALEIDKDLVKSFKEKPRGDGALINGGFFVLSTNVIDLIKGDDTIWEQEPLNILSNKSELAVYKHYGFWQPVDTIRDRDYLNDLWSKEIAPWKIW